MSVTMHCKRSPSRPAKALRQLGGGLDAIGDEAEQRRGVAAAQECLAPAPTPSRRECSSSSARRRLRFCESSFLAARPRDRFSTAASRSSFISCVEARALVGADPLAFGQLGHV
jgi:hypothetical protein